MAARSAATGIRAVAALPRCLRLTGPGQAETAVVGAVATAVGVPLSLDNRLQEQSLFPVDKIVLFLIAKQQSNKVDNSVAVRSTLLLTLARGA